MKRLKFSAQNIAIGGGIIVVLGCASGVAMDEESTAPANPTGGATAAPNKPAVPVIEEGVWIVGTDFPAGTYRTAAALTPDQLCYWAITKAGSNGNDIIANDNPTGGRPSVTVKKGQEFTNQGCGTFVKVS